jgi:protein arginine kinase
MKVDHLLKQTCEWLRGTGPNSDIVMSSRIRLARNLEKIAFSHWATKKQEKETLDVLEQTLSRADMTNNNLNIRMNKIDDVDKQFLLERHLISREHIVRPDHKSVLIGDKEVISVMINEEDHLRQACFRPGLGLNDAWETLTELDDAIGSRLPLSYDSALGYVTACPSNMGTGLRASCLLHLPALVLTGRIQAVINELTGAALHARGFYGEGTTAFGDLFQISNVKTLGQTEAHLIRDVEHAIKEICAFEKREEENLMSADFRLKTEDLIYRAFGTLRSARALNFVEGMKYVSLVRLGLKLGKDLPLKLDDATSFFFLAQPGHLQMKSVRTRQTLSDEVLRADFFRGALKNL